MLINIQDIIISMNLHARRFNTSLIICRRYVSFGTLTQNTGSLYLIPCSAIDWSCLKLMSKENNDAGWRPCPHTIYEMNFWRGKGLPAEVTCLLREMPRGTRTFPEPFKCSRKKEKWDKVKRYPESTVFRYTSVRTHKGLSQRGGIRTQEVFTGLLWGQAQLSEPRVKECVHLVGTDLRNGMNEWNS